MFFLRSVPRLSPFFTAVISRHVGIGETCHSTSTFDPLKGEYHKESRALYHMSELSKQQTVGCNDLFMKTKLGPCQVVRNYFRTPIPKFNIFILLYNLRLRKRRLLSKNRQKICFKNKFQPCARESLQDIYELKMKRNTKKNVFPLTKTNFPIFKFNFWRLFFEVIAMYLQILRKYCSFLRLLHRYIQ